jgi:hypothetical protein
LADQYYRWQTQHLQQEYQIQHQQIEALHSHLGLQDTQPQPTAQTAHRT